MPTTLQLETLPITSNYPPQAEANIEHLEQAGVLGTYFAGLYQAALAEAPELADVIIKPTDKTTMPLLAHTGGAARHQGAGNGIQPEVAINTGDGWEHYTKLMESRPASVRVSAEKVGIDPSRITPQELAGVIFLHELGHARYYLTEAPDLEIYKEQRKLQMKTLPIPGYNPAKLIHFLESDAGREYFAQNREALLAAGLRNPDDLVHLQEKAYHNLPTEDYPDKFAAQVMNT
jgi:hypothetical protein